MNTLKNIWLKLRFALLTIILLTAYGCGGGGGTAGVVTSSNTTLSGTASAGAPIIGTVTIKDSSTPAKEKFVTIAADGKYTIDVSGLTAPFMMRADGTVGGRSYSLYSGATSADVGGTINVTPLTDLIVANVAGQIASAYFATGNFSGLTAAELSAQETALQARLQPILTAVGVAGSIDLLRSSFATDHTGLDAALDVLRIDIVGGTATITNIIDNQQITDDLASQADDSVIVATDVAAGLSELQQIVAGFDAFSAQFATSPPAADNATLLALFEDDTTFLFDGQNRTALLSNLTSDPSMVGVKFTNVALVPNSMIPANAPMTAKVIFSVIQGGSIQENMEFTLNKANDAWKIAGNGHIARTKVGSYARLQDCPTTGSIDSGLYIEIEDKGGYGIDYAIVTGPGLPQDGALYVNYGQNSGFGVAMGSGNIEYIGTVDTPHLGNCEWEQYPLADDVITTLADNAEYTISLYDDNDTLDFADDDVLLNDTSYTVSAGKRPYLSTELTAASLFGAFTAPTKTALLAFARSTDATTTISVTWTLPSGMSSVGFDFWRQDTTSNNPAHKDNLWTQVSPTATNANLTMTAPVGYTPNGSGLWLEIRDSFDRRLNTNYWSQDQAAVQ